MTWTFVVCSLVEQSWVGEHRPLSPLGMCLLDPKRSRRIHTVGCRHGPDLLLANHAVVLKWTRSAGPPGRLS